MFVSKTEEIGMRRYNFYKCDNLKKKIAFKLL